MYRVKKYIQISILFVVMFAVSVEAAPLMSLAQPAIEPSPLESVEKNGEGNITFLMSERNDVEVSGDNRFKVTISMSKVDLKNADTAGIKIEDGRNAYQEVTNKFNITYLSDDKMVIVQQKSTEALPANMRFLVTIPIVVTTNTPITNPDNGFLVNMSAEGDAAADGDSSDYTYTMVAINAIDDTEDSISGSIAIDNITQNDTLNTNSVILGTDVTISNVTDNTPLVVDMTTGKVSVPAGTATGIYTETYTLCEAINTNNCANADIIVSVISNPDYRPILTVYGGIVHGEGVHNFSFDTLVRNIVSGSDYDVSKPLTITIPKNKALSLTFDDTMTLFKGSIVQNNLWSFDASDPFDYIIVFDGSALDNDRSRFALNGTLTVEAGETGKFFLEVTIKSSTGGDSNIENNSDRETLEKRLQ